MAEKVDQDVREAAADLWRLLEEHPRAESILAGNHDQAQTVQILARIKEAGRQAGLRQAADALKPFAQCADELDYEDKARSEYADEPFDTPDDEWAKFRLLVSDYRRAREAFAAITALMEGEGK